MSISHFCDVIAECQCCVVSVLGYVTVARSLLDYRFIYSRFCCRIRDFLRRNLTFDIVSFMQSKFSELEGFYVNVAFQFSLTEESGRSSFTF